MDHSEVSELFGMLLEEIDTVVKALNESGAEAFLQGNYEEASRIAEKAQKVGEFRERVLVLKGEWEALFSPPEEGKGGKRIWGMRTPESAFRQPILEALVELGGSARTSEVLSLVEKKMIGTLNEHDYQRLRSGSIRWQNTAQWCRLKMVREGLLKQDSPMGIWEISDRGRAELERMKSLGRSGIL